MVLGLKKMIIKNNSFTHNLKGISVFLKLFNLYKKKQSEFARIDSSGKPFDYEEIRKYERGILERPSG